MALKNQSGRIHAGQSRGVGGTELRFVPLARVAAGADRRVSPSTLRAARIASGASFLRDCRSRRSPPTSSTRSAPGWRGIERDPRRTSQCLGREGAPTGSVL